MKEECLRFTPHRVEGLSDVTEVTIYPACLKLASGERCHTINFSEIVHLPKPKWLWRVLAYLGFRPSPWMIGEKEWLHTPAKRFIRFYAAPQITVFMPVDEPEEYFESYYWRSQMMIAKGGFQMVDMG